MSGKTESEARLKAIIETAGEGIITADEHGLIESVNPAAARMFGYLPEEIIGKSLNVLMPRPHRDHHQQYMEKYVKTGEAKVIGKGREGMGLKKNGTLFPIHLSISEVPLGDRKLFTGVIHDLTEQKRTEDELRQREQFHRSILENAFDGISIIDRKGIIFYQSPSVEKILGYKIEELIGHPALDLLHPEDLPLAIKKQKEIIRKRGGTTFTEVRLRHKDGSWRWMQAKSINLLSDPNIKGIITNFRDITENKVAEEKLQRYAADLERSNSELENFAYIASHDLQEPLRKIRAFGERLRARDGESLSERGEEYLTRIQNAAARLQVLIDDLLRFSRLTTRAQPFEQVSLSNIIGEVLNDLELMIERNHAEVSCSPLPQLEAEPTMMRQLFQNLIANAIKFSKEEEAPQIRIYAAPPEAGFDNMVRIVIEDKGIGFSPQYAEKIFQLFQRLEGRKREGSGIGLAVCKRIVDWHRGNIAVQSTPGEGTVFTIHLPLSQGGGV